MKRPLILFRGELCMATGHALRTAQHNAAQDKPLREIASAHEESAVDGDDLPCDVVGAF